MAKKKKDPLAAAARQVVKDTANKAVKQTAKPNVKKQQPKQSSRQSVRQNAKDVSNLARNTMRNAGESTKKATVSTAKALPKKKAKPFKASDLSGNTGRGVTKQARKQTQNAYAGASQRKAQAKQKEKDIKAGKFNVPNRLGQADEMMLSKEGKNQVNYWKDQWEKAKARGDKAGMQKAHEEAEKVRLTNPATVKTTTYEGPTQSQVTMAALQQYAQAMQAGDEEGMRQAKNLAAYAMLNVPKDNREQSYMTGAYSGGTWGDRYLEASESDVLKNQGKNLLKSEGAAFASAVPEAAGGYIETVMNAPDMNGGSSQLVVKDQNVDKRKASQFDLRGQSRYTEEDARAKADHYQAQAEYLKQIAYATTPLPGVVGKFAVDATAAAGGMGIDLAANTIVPGAGLISMGARTWGSSVQQAKDYQKVNGTDKDPYADAKAYLYGTAIAGTEVLSEKMFGGPWSKIYGRGFADAAVKGATKPTIGKTILKGMLEEGSEELAADLVQWKMPAIYGGDVETLPEMLKGAAYDFTLGAALGGLGGAVTAPGQVRQQKLDNLKKRAKATGLSDEDVDRVFKGMTVGELELLTDATDGTLSDWIAGRQSGEGGNNALDQAAKESYGTGLSEKPVQLRLKAKQDRLDALGMRMKKLGLENSDITPVTTGFAKKKYDNELIRVTEMDDSEFMDWLSTQGINSSQIENQSLTEASEAPGEQSSEQTFEGRQETPAPKAEISRGKAWDALRSRLRESGVRDAQMLRTIRDRMSVEEMEEAANLRKNDFLEWKDRVTSPDYQPAPREEAPEPTENITAEELNEEEEDELSTISPAQINKLGDKLRELGVDSRAVARAISDDAVLEQLVNMDAEELRTWAEEQKAPAKPSNEEVSEMLREQEEMLAERRERESKANAAPVTGDAALVNAMADYLGDAGRSTMIGHYDPKNIKDASRYVLETRLAYNAGFTGNQISRTMNRVISPETANRMYEAGVMDKQAVNEQRRRKQARAKFYSGNEAGLGRDANGHYLDEYVENLARQSKENAMILDEIDRTSKAFGAKVLFPDAIAVRNKEGKATETADGGYTQANIMLDKDLGKALEYTYGHELTHRMAEIDPNAYEGFKKYVMSRPDSEKMYTELQYEYNRREIEADHDLLVEETCAEFSGAMISQADMLRDFAKMADQNVVQRFFQALRDMARKLTGREKAYVERAVKVLDDAYRERYGVSMSREMKEKTTADVKAVGEMYESSLKQARKMASRPASFNSMQEDTDTKYSIKSIFNSAGLDVEQVDGKIVATDRNGKPITKVNTKMVRESGIGALILYARDETKVISAKEAEKQLKGAKDLLNMMLKAQDGDLVWRFAGSAMFSAVKSNSDGQYGTTIDFSTVCRKTQEMMTAMSDAMVRLGRGLTKDEVIELQSDILTVEGTVPCPVCYVFSRWAGVGGILDNMAKFQKKYGHEYDDPAKLQKAIDDLEKATKTKASLREMLREHDSVYMDLEQRVEEMQADNKAKKKEVKNLNKNKPDGYGSRVRELELAIRMNDGMITQAKEDIKKLEAEGAPELAWLKKVRSDPNYWNKEGGGYVDEKVLFNLDDAATFAEKYPIAWKYRTTRGPSAGKAILPYSDMRLGDLILGAGKNSAQGKDTFKTVENGEFNDDQIKAIDRARQRTRAQNLIGGQRFQSTSDFRYDYGLDYLQVFWEAQALGTNMQTYTKIVEFAELAAAVGGDVNLSVMPLNNGLDKKGNLLYSSVTGMDIEAAQKANEMYDNVQLILVGINDEHILTALDDEPDQNGKYHGGQHVGFVIPYHASGASINKFIRGLVENLRETFNEDYYKDYSPVQEDSKKKIPGASEEVVKVWMEAMRENPRNPQFKGRKPNAKQRKALEQRLRHEIRAALLKHKIGGSSVAADKFVNDNLEFFRGTSKDISSMSFEELRDIEQKALSGDADAIAEYESWSNGFLWDIYQKMWVDESATDTYGVTLNTAQAGSVMPHEYWNKEVDREHAYINGFLFRSYCYNLGLTPRFTGVNSAGRNVGYGDFSISKGYWKTLIDRPMYDNQGRYRDQQKINVTEITGEMLTPEYGEKKWGDYKVQEPDDKRARRAADRFVERKQNGASGETMMYSIRSRDSEYLQAVRDGDVEKAQRMVDEAAKEAGYPTRLYHGTNRFGWTEPDTKYSDDGISFFASTSEETAGSYTGEKNIRRVSSSNRKRRKAGGYMYKDLRFDSEEDLEEFKKAFPTYTPQMEIDELEDEIDSYDSDEYDRIDNLRREFLDAMDAYRKYDWSHSRPTTFRELRDNPDKYGIFDVERAILSWDPNMGLFDFFEDPYGTPVEDLVSDMFYGFEEYASEEDNDFTFEQILDMTFPGRVPEGESFQEKAQGVYDLFANTNNMEEIDGHGAYWNGIMYRGRQMSTRGISKIVESEGKYDGVIIRNIYDTAGSKALPASDIYIFHKPARQIKSADPITYDDSGNIIPLSERFNPDIPDIRWALRGGRTVEELAAAYGIIPPGEKRAREVRVPQQTEDDNRVSRAIRTIMEAQTTPEQLLPRIEEMIANGEFSYSPITNKESVAKARATINELGYDEAWRKWSNDIDDRKASSDVVTLGWILYDDALKDGNTDKALEICAKMARFGSQLGQAVQALSILKRLPTELQMRMIPQPRPKHVQDKIDEYEEEEDDDEFDPLAPDEYDEDTGLPKPKKPRKPREKKKPTQEEVDQMEEDTAKYQIEHSKITLKDKWDAWRYLAMLANFRTHIRNIVGNLGFAPIIITKNLTATVSEIALYNTFGKSRGMQRTKGFYGLSQFHYAWNDFTEMRPIIMGEAKWEGQESKPDKIVFRGILAPIEKLRNFNGSVLDKEDALFSRPQYANALAQFMAANGITVEMMETGVGRIEKGPHKDEEFNGGIMQEARAYAVKEAQKATYRDLNNISKLFMQLGKVKDPKNRAERFTNILVEGIFPFRKTPANILCRSVEYSPAGFVNGIWKLTWGVWNTCRIQEKVSRGEKLKDWEMEFKPVTVAEALDRLCSGLSGTGIFILGMYLAKMGLLVAKSDDGDDNQYYFDKLLGHQQWALEIFDYSVTIDWLAPEVVPLFMGAQYFTSMSSGNPIRNVSNMLDSATMILDPVMELSCLSGIQETLNNTAKFAEGDLNTMTSLIASMGLSYLTQGVPTLFGQLERVSQADRMQTFATENPDAMFSEDWQYQIGKISAKIPGRDYQQVPYIDSWGNTETETSMFKRIVANMFNPAYIKKIDTREVNKELQRLYDVTGDGYVFPKPVWKSYNFKDENGVAQTYYLTEEEWVATSRAKGRESFDLVQKFMNSKAYKEMSDPDRADMISDLYSYADYKASKAYIHNYRKELSSATKWIEKYETFSNAIGGYDVLDYKLLDRKVHDVTGVKLNASDSSKPYTTACAKLIAVYDSGAKIPSDPAKRDAMMEALDISPKVRNWTRDAAKEFNDKEWRKLGVEPPA